MNIKPSNIFYSHDTIMYRFRKQKYDSGCYGRRRFRWTDGKPIGKTLDELCNGDCKIDNIPKIKITKKDGKWYTLDNRRLWVFHHYEAYLKEKGETLTIPVEVEEYNEDSHERRFTTKDGGVTIKIKDGNDPTGDKYKVITPVTPIVEEKHSLQEENVTEKKGTPDEKGECSTANVKYEVKNEEGQIHGHSSEEENVTENNDTPDEIEKCSAADVELEVENAIEGEKSSDLLTLCRFSNFEKAEKNSIITRSNHEILEKCTSDMDTRVIAAQATSGIFVDTEIKNLESSVNDEISDENETNDVTNEESEKYNTWLNRIEEQHGMNTVNYNNVKEKDSTAISKEERIDSPRYVRLDEAEKSDETQGRKRGYLLISDVDFENTVEPEKRHKQNDN